MNRRNALIDMLAEPSPAPRNRLTDFLDQPSTADIHATLDQTVTNRGNFVPLVEYASGRVGPGWPNFLPGHKVADMLSPGYDYDHPQAARDAFDVAGMVGVGSLAMPRPRGSIGSGGRPELDMSDAVRMQRAREMGFDTDTVWYHGTTEPNLQEILPGKKEPGAWFARDIKTAADYVRGEDGDLHKTFLKTRNPMVVDFDYIDDVLTPFHRGQPLPIDNNVAIVQHAQRLGFDSVRFPYGNFSEAGDTMVVFDPSQIRATSAAFDPRFHDSGNLYAARGLPMLPWQTQDED